MWDDDFDEDHDLDADEDLDPETLAREVALSSLAVQLWAAVGDYGHFRMPVPSPVCGYRWNRPRLDDDALMTLSLALSQGQLMREHDRYIVWELQRAWRI